MYRQRDVGVPFEMNRDRATNDDGNKLREPTKQPRQTANERTGPLSKEVID